MKIAVIGGRNFTNYSYVEKTLNSFIDNHVEPGDEIIIVSGGAKGADSMGEYYAKIYKYKTIIHLPDWELHGKAAGMIRNTNIIDSADVIFAFWDGESKGTKDSINKANKLNKPLYIIKY